jgi:PilZ domain
MNATEQPRQHERHSTRVPVLFGIVFPQDTFTPFYEETCVWNLSVNGGLVTVTLPDRIIQKCMTEPHYCRLQFSVEGMPGRVLGKVVWAEKDSGGRTWTHKVGVRFDQITPRDLQRLELFLAQVDAPEQKQNIVDTISDCCLEAG